MIRLQSPTCMPLPPIRSMNKTSNPTLDRRRRRTTFDIKPNVCYFKGVVVSPRGHGDEAIVTRPLLLFIIFLYVILLNGTPLSKEMNVSAAET